MCEKRLVQNMNVKNADARNVIVIIMNVSYAIANL